MRNEMGETAQQKPPRGGRNVRESSDDPKGAASTIERVAGQNNETPRLDTVNESKPDANPRGNNDRNNGDIEQGGVASSEPTLDRRERRRGENNNADTTKIADPTTAQPESFFAEHAKNNELKNKEQLRTEKIEALRGRSRYLNRTNAQSMPELHFVGQLTSCIGAISDPNEGCYVRWKIEHGEALQHISGELLGQTQIGYPSMSANEDIVLSHPIDVHFAELGMQGFGSPRILVQSFVMDAFGRRVLNGYGVVSIPICTGMFSMEVPMWRPSGSTEQELEAFFLGRTPALVSPDPIYNSAWKERCSMITTSAGSVRIDLFVVSRFAKNQGRDMP